MDEIRRRRKCSGEDSDDVSDISNENKRNRSEQGSDCDNSDYESLEEGQLLDSDDVEVAAITENTTEQTEEVEKLDDDEDRKNPQYIPKKGTFYEHDNRNGSENDDGKDKETPETGDKPDPKKKIWKENDKWLHDKFDLNEQTPKSQQDLITSYGYDIRNEEGPPKGNRTRRYGRGPNKYTRNWEDLEAYKPSRGRTSAEPRRGSARSHHDLESETDFPSLVVARDSNGDGYRGGEEGEDSVTVPDSEGADNTNNLVDSPDNRRNFRDSKEQSYPNSGYRDNYNSSRGRGGYNRGGRGDNRNSQPRYDKDNYPERSFRGRSDHDAGYRGRKDSDGAYRGRRDADGGYRGRRESDGGFRGRSDYDGGYRGRKESDTSYRGRNYSETSYRGKNSSDGNYRGRNSQEGGYRGRNNGDGGYRGRGGDRDNRRGSYTSGVIEQEVANPPQATQPTPPKDDYRLNRSENVKPNMPPRLQKEASPPNTTFGQPIDAKSKVTKRYSTQRQRGIGEPNPSFQHPYFEQERPKPPPSKNYGQPAGYPSGAPAFPTTDTAFLPRVPVVPQIMAAAPRPHLIAGPPPIASIPGAVAVAVAPAIAHSPATVGAPFMAPENILTYAANPAAMVATAPQFPPYQTYAAVPQPTPTEIYRNGVTYYSTQNQQHPRVAPPLQKRAKAAIPIRQPPTDDDSGGPKSGEDAAYDEANEADGLSAPDYEGEELYEEAPSLASDDLNYDESLPIIGDSESDAPDQSRESPVGSDRPVDSSSTVAECRTDKSSGVPDYPRDPSIVANNNATQDELVSSVGESENVQESEVSSAELVKDTSSSHKEAEATSSSPKESEESSAEGFESTSSSHTEAESTLSSHKEAEESSAEVVEDTSFSHKEAKSTSSSHTEAAESTSSSHKEAESTSDSQLEAEATSSSPKEYEESSAELVEDILTSHKETEDTSSLPKESKEPSEKTPSLAEDTGGILPKENEMPGCVEADKQVQSSTEMGSDVDNASSADAVVVAQDAHSHTEDNIAKPDNLNINKSATEDTIGT